MPAFRRVDGQFAGATALGILVPPGKSTVVILRPRGLDWDLLPARWEGDARSAPAFCQFGRDEAALVARRCPPVLEESVAAGVNPVETFGSPQTTQFQVWVRTQEYVWIVCQRQPGLPYRPLILATQEEAESVGRRLEPFFHPATDANQEYYFNTQSFTD